MVNTIKEVEEAVIKLEIQGSYSEEKISQLNQVIINQQRDLDRLSEKVDKLELLIKKDKEQQDGYDFSHKKPPHY